MALGASDDTPAFDLTDATNYPTSSLTGTISIAQGGTGQTTYTAGQLLIGNSSNGLTKSTLTAGNNVTITNGDGSITIESTNTTYTIQDGQLSEKNFTTTLKNKLDGIEDNADVTDSANVESAGAVMNTGNETIAGVKTFSNIIEGSINGNAATATTLETTRTIAGKSFNGSQNITIALSDLSNVATTVPNSNGQVLTWNGSAWAPATASGGGSSVWSTSGDDINYTTGKVGIGTDSPDSTLHILGPSDSSPFVYFEQQHSSGDFRWYIKNDEFTVQRKSGSSYGNQTMYLNYNGSGVTVESLSQSSDNKIKHNEKPIENALEIIDKLKPQTYFKSNKVYGENHNYDLDSSGNPITNDDYKIETGLIAQDIQKIPELSSNVASAKDDILSLNYNGIFIYNIKATQELHTKNKDLEAKVASLESELSAIKAHLGL